MAVVNTAASTDWGGLFQQLGQRFAQQRIANAYTDAFDQSQLQAPQQPQPTGLGQLAGPAPSTPATPPATGLASLAPAPPAPPAPQQPTVSPGAPSSAPLPSFATLQGGMPASNVGQLWGGLEQRYGLPQGYLAKTASIESNGNPNALNKGSGAAGAFQFVPSTAAQYGLTDPTNIAQSSIAAARLASDNANVLRQALGRDPTAGELYLAHQQGAAGAAKLLTNPDAPAASIVGANAVTSNGGSGNMTAGQFASKWVSRVDGGSPAAPTQVAGGASPNGGLPNSPFGSMLGPRAAVGGAPAPVPTFANGAPPMMQATGFAPQPSPGVPQPSPAMAYAPQQPAASSAPAAAAIGSATYGSVPLSVNGKMMTRQEAEDTDGLDHSDYDDAAVKAGILASAKIAPPFVDRPAAAPAVAAAAPASPAMTPVAQIAPPAPAGAPPAGEQPPGNRITPELIRTLMSNPDTQPLGLQLWQGMLQPKDSFQQYTDKDGSIWQRNAITGASTLLQDNSKETNDWRVAENGGAPFEYNSKTAEVRPVSGIPGVLPGTKTHVLAAGGALVDDTGKPLYTNGGSAAAADPALVESLARRIYMGDTTATTGLSRGPQGAALIAAAQERAGQLAAQYQGQPLPDFAEGDILKNRADQMGLQAGARTSGQLTARLDTYAQEASGAMKLAIDASNQVPRGNWVPVNKVIQAYQSGTSDPNLARFGAAVNSLVNTYAKAINPVGVPTVEDKRHAYDMLNTAQGPEAFSAVVQQLQREVNIAHNSARGARAAARDGTGAEPIADPTAGSASADPNIAAARAAIANGADRGAVIQRLQQSGIDPSGL